MITSRIVVSGISLLFVGVAACSGFGEDVSVGSDTNKLGGDKTDAGAGSTDGGKPCKSPTDCGEGAWVCGYSPTSSCGDFGVCISTAGQAQCAAYSPGCSCGNTVNLACNGIPDGYVIGPGATPTSSTGTCGGAADAGTCTTNADCGSDGMCGFSTTDISCTNVGQCYPKASGAVCNAYVAACACDGTTVNTICEGYPSNVASKPIAHPGACDGG